MYLVRSRRIYFLSNIFYILIFLFLYVFFATLQNADKNKTSSKVSYNEPVVEREHNVNQIPGFSTPVHDHPNAEKTPSPQKLRAQLLEDIDFDEPRPMSSKSAKQIFFIETTNPDGGQLELNPREACSVESAALFHPDHDIYVMFTGPTTFVTSGQANNITKMHEVLTRNYKNIYYRSVSLDDISKGSALEEFVRTKKYQTSSHLKSHLSDILRYLILWKYGGLFFDLDIVVLKNFDKLTENYVGRSSNNFLMSGTMQFSGTGIGHTVAEKCLTYLRDNFDGKRWAANGPEVITAVMKDICNTNLTSEMTKISTKRCKGMQVYHAALFLPITDNFMYFREAATDTALIMVEHAYTAHIYNHASKRVKLTRESRCAYLELAKKFCPNVYESFDTYF